MINVMDRITCMWECVETQLSWRILCHDYGDDARRCTPSKGALLFTP
jgi:hypothetical protein